MASTSPVQSARCSCPSKVSVKVPGTLRIELISKACTSHSAPARAMPVATEPAFETMPIVAFEDVGMTTLCPSAAIVSASRRGPFPKKSSARVRRIPDADAAAAGTAPPR